MTRLEFNSHARQDLRCFDGVGGGHVLASGEILNHPMSNSYVEKTFGFVSKDAEHFHNSSVALKVDCRDNFHHRCVCEECSQASLCQHPELTPASTAGWNRSQGTLFSKQTQSYRVEPVQLSLEVLQFSSSQQLPPCDTGDRSE